MAPIGIFTSTPQGRFISANPAMAEMYGYDSVEDFIQSITDITSQIYVDPQDRAEFIRLLEEQGQVINHECRFLRKDGSVFWVSRNARAVRDQQGNILAYQGFTTDITERKQAEQALKESEERYRKLINTSPDAIALVDEHGRFLTVNPAMARRFDLTQQELTGKTYHQVMPRDLADKRIMDAARSINNEELIYFEDERQGRHLQNYYVPIATSGQQKTFQIIARDITERKQAEEKFRILFESANDAIFLMQEDQFIECNAKTLEMFDCSREQILGKPPYQFSTASQPDGRSSQEKALEKINACLQGDPQFFEWQHIRYDGTAFDTEVSLNRVDIGSEVFIQAIVRDITSRKQAEDALRESQEFSSTLMNSAPYPIVVKDPNSVLTYVNPAFESLTGFTSSEVIGKKPPYPWWSEDSLQKISKDFHIIFHEDLHQVEELFQKKNGERFWVVITTARVFQENGTVKLYLSNWVDITERKKMEERLRELSFHDTLTGLYNRAFFEEEMHRLETGRYCPLGIIVCDIDGLKLINDTCGHHQGDKLLKDAADILGRCFRVSDIIARIGGDEFAVLLPQSGQEIVRQSCSRIRARVEDYNQKHPEFGLSISIGFAVKNNQPIDMNKLFKRADNAMYREKLQQSHSSRSAIVQALIKTMEARDNITEGHASRLQDNALQLGQYLGLSEERLNDLQLLARFHDLGKVGVPDRILLKPGPLTEEEFQEMQRHCEIGQRIALATTDLAPIAEYILKHHEWWNGQGYPLGIKGQDIPIECRILAIADAFDAMTSDRPYRKALPHRQAVQELQRCAGTQFDPYLVQCFLEIVKSPSNRYTKESSSFFQSC